MKKIVVAAVLLLAGCQTQPGTVSDVHTGVQAKHSGMHQVYNGLFDSLWVTAISGTRGGNSKYGVGVRYLSTGQQWAFFQSAWSFGKQLRFKTTNSQVAGCGGGNCSKIEEGVVELTRAEFESAAANGLEFKLIGRNKELTVKVPAKVFKDAM